MTEQYQGPEQQANVRDCAVTSCNGKCKGGCAEMDATKARLDEGGKRMDTQEEQLAAIKADVEEVLDILRLGKSFFRILGYFGSAVKWLAVIIGPCVGLYYTWKGGQK